MNTGTMCIHVCVSSYSKVDAIEQRYMVNSGVRGKKDRNPRSGWVDIDILLYLIPGY
jgi:hypothetical protein